MKIFLSSILILILLISLNACKDPGTDKEDFDRASMLINVADNLIIPNYQEMQSKMSEFTNKLNTFNTSPNQTTLDDLRIAWLNAYKQWQHCKVYELGEAANIALRTSINTFPTDTAQVNANVLSGSYTLGTIANLQAIGFPAFDYLLFDGLDTDIISKTAASSNLRQYYVDVAAKMTSEIDFVLNNWTNSYRNSFVASTGSASGSSTNNLYNELVYDLELIKNAKFGIPLGKDILDIARPTYVEAFYSGYSNILAIENMKSIENLFLGRSVAGVDGIGFDEYCDFVEAKRGSEDLTTVIKNQFALLEVDMALIPDPLSGALVSNYSQVNALYFTIQTQVLYIKTDMSSALGLIIEFFDNDGD